MSASTIPAGIPAAQGKTKRPLKGKLIGAIGLLVVAAIVAVGSGANFTAHTANPGNMVTEGAFSMSNTKDGLALFAPQTSWDPTETVTGYVNVGNVGNEVGAFTVKATEETGNDPEFAKNVFIQVTEYGQDPDTNHDGVAGGVGDTNVTVDPNGINFAGSLYNFQNGCTSDGGVAKLPNSVDYQACQSNRTYNGTAWSLTDWQPNETHYYRFRLINAAPDGDGNNALVRSFQGKTAKFGVNWDAVSTA